MNRQEKIETLRAEASQLDQEAKSLFFGFRPYKRVAV